MTKNEFKNFCKQVFEEYGFKKIKNTFYLRGKDLLCGIELQKSNYGSIYYINYFYFIGNYSNITNYPTYYESDLGSRIAVLSKTQTFKGECFLTGQIEYEEYTEEELKSFFDNDFVNKVLPPVHIGKKFILENLGVIYKLTLNKEEVLRKLQE